MTVVALQADWPIVPPSRQPRVRLTPSAAFFFALMTFSVTALASFWLTHNAEQLSLLGFSGFTVPDALSLDKSVHLAWSAGWEVIPNINTFLGTVLLYYPTILFGSAYSAVANISLLSLSSVLFYSTVARVDGLKNPIRLWIAATFIVATNLYIVSCVSYPNKEIPLVFLTSAAIFGIIVNKWYLTAVSVCICYWFRDGYALILAMVCAMMFFRRFMFAAGGIIAATFLMLLLVVYPMRYFSSVSGALERNVSIGAEIAGDKFSVHGDVAAFAARLVGNTVNLGLRPQMIDVHGGIYLLGVGYWQFGLILLAGLIWAVRNLFSSSIARGSLALVVLTALIGVSYGSFVQPRYMMPLIFVLTLGLSESRLGRYVAIPATVVFPIVFLILGLLPPLADG